MSTDLETQPEIALDRFTMLVDGLDHPEGVATGPDGRLYAGGEAGQIYRLDPAGATLLANTGGFILGLCLDIDSVIYACDQGRHEVVRVDTDGTVVSYSEYIQTPNYPVFAEDGTLFVSDSGTWDGNDGSMVRIGPDGVHEKLDLDTGAFPNGLALSPDGAWLYVVMSQLPGVVRVPVAGGRPTGDAEVHVSMPDHVPDGVACLANGDLLISCYAPDTIYRFSDGRLSVLAHDPRRVLLAAPANVTFHGPDLTHLAVSSLGRWHIASADIGLPGAPLRYPTFGRRAASGSPS